jgi:hypothetical protein
MRSRCATETLLSELPRSNRAPNGRRGVTSISGSVPDKGPRLRELLSGKPLLYILDGEAELEIQDGGAARELLRPGDSGYFQTSCPRRIRGITRSPYAAHAAEAVVVFGVRRMIPVWSQVTRLRGGAPVRRS